MTITFVGSTSGNGGCPTLYRTDYGTLIVQGTTVTDPAALAAIDLHSAGIPDHHSVVEVPAELLRFVDIRALPTVPHASGADTDGIYRSERGTLIVRGATVTAPEALAEMRRHGNGIPDYESAVEVSAELLAVVELDLLYPITLPAGRPQLVVDPEVLPAAGR
jgi:hypothetical protein